MFSSIVTAALLLLSCREQLPSPRAHEADPGCTSAVLPWAASAPPHQAPAGHQGLRSPLTHFMPTDQCQRGLSGHFTPMNSLKLPDV